MDGNGIGGAELTQRLCRKIAGTTSSALGESQRAAARQLVLDGLCVAVAGAAEERSPSILAQYFAAQGGRPEASILGMDLKLPAAQAALVNAASMHVLDYEPMWLPATHALSPALSAALSLVEEAGATGLELCTAVVKGIEIQGWLRQAGVTESRELRFHPPGFVGPFGAAVAAAHVLSLEAEALANSFGIAGSRCGGLFSNLGTMTKSAHCGYAAQSGVEAVLLTRLGFTASPTILDPGRQSYALAYMPQSFDPEVLMNFGETGFRVLDPGFAIKAYPAKFSTHYGIVAALALRKRLRPAPEIQAIHITAADVPSSNRPVPASGLDGKFSLQYTVAAALLDGKVETDSFTDARLNAPDMQDLLRKISASFPPEIPSQYATGRYAEVSVTLADGTTLTERCTNPPGSWQGKELPSSMHREKAMQCLGTRLSPERAAEVVDLCEGVDSLGAEELRRLISLVSVGRRPTG